MNSRSLVWGSLLVLALVLLLPGTQARKLRPVSAAIRAELARHLDPFWLTNHLGDRLVIEIDVVEGTAVHPRALDQALERFRELLPPGKQVDVRIDDTIPRAEWDAAPGDFEDKARALAHRLDADPGGWRERELLWMLYVPGESEVHGWQVDLPLIDGDERGIVPTVFIFADQIDESAALWIGRRKIERSVLIHEWGHAVGLVCHPERQRAGDPGHCTSAGCVLATHSSKTMFVGAVRSIFAGKLATRFCKHCRRDIAVAREEWDRLHAEGRLTRDARLVRATREHLLFTALEQRAKQASIDAEPAAERQKGPGRPGPSNRNDP